MKKLIAIAVVFALVMGGVFAETSVSGSANGKLVLGQGKTGEDSTVDAGGSMKLKISGKNEEGNFGGEFLFNADNRAASLKDPKSNVWWKPIDMLKIQIGSDEWGSFGIDNGGTGIYGNMDDLDIWQSIGAGKDFGSITGKGLFLSVTPISGLEFDVAIPFFNVNGAGFTAAYWPAAKEVYKRFQARLVYNINNIGKVQAAYRSASYELGDPGKIGVDFDLSALSGMGLALAFQLNTYFPTGDADLATTESWPLNLLFSFGFTAGDFNVKFRFTGEFLGKTTVNDVVTNETTATVRFGLFPNFKVSDALFVGVGFDVQVNNIGEDLVTGDKLKTNILWHASPHLRYTVGPGLFQAGLNVGSKTGAEGILEWQIPIRIAYSF